MARRRSTKKVEKRVKDADGNVVTPEEMQKRTAKLSEITGKSKDEINMKRHNHGRGPQLFEALDMTPEQIKEFRDSISPE